MPLSSRLGTTLTLLFLLGAGCVARDDAPPPARRPDAALTDSLRADASARARQDSANRARPGYVVDSILPVDEELRRFRAASGGTPVTRLAGGSDSRDGLVRRFARALSANDSSALRAMVLTAREFADLYYPESPYTRPPMRQSPAVAWTLIQNPSTAGLTRIMRRLGGRPLGYRGQRCDPRTVREGRNVRYTGCLVDLIGADGRPVTRRLFGSIIQRDGVYKFMSYTNQL